MHLFNVPACSEGTIYCTLCRGLGKGTGQGKLLAARIILKTIQPFPVKSLQSSEVCRHNELYRMA